MRQRPSRYAIRAGQNLPDKEFRYLRTVIVTAAVYWGFGSQLRIAPNRPLTFQHRAGVSPYTSPCGFAQTCVFAKQSLGPFHCGPLGLFTLPRHPFSRSYGVILPSSLTRVLPRALACSARLPVSVCGTGTFSLARGFSWQLELMTFGTVIFLPITAQPYGMRICLHTSLTAWTSIHQLASLSFCVTPSLITVHGGTGISTCCPSTTPFGLALGPDLP